MSKSNAYKVEMIKNFPKVDWSCDKKTNRGSSEKSESNERYSNLNGYNLCWY